jgi:hypothetical protein
MTLLTSDDELRAPGDAFSAGRIPREQWTHAAHLAVTVYVPRMRQDVEAELAIPAMIRALNEAQGGRNTDTEGYHHTITLASTDARLGWVPSDRAPLTFAVRTDDRIEQ